jgi:hypothetical protein
MESTYPNFPTGKLAQPWLTHDVKPRNMVYALKLGTSDGTWWQMVFLESLATTLSKSTNSASAVPSDAKIETKYLETENQASYQLTKRSKCKQ